MNVQLPLKLITTPGSACSFASFVPDANLSVCQAVQHAVSGKNETCLYLWGETGTGKTHLLQAACDQETTQGGTPVYLPLKDLHNLPAEAVEGLEQVDLVCLDDVQNIAGIPEWEHALFSLFNQLRESGTLLLISGIDAPDQLGLDLKDLVSRLKWGGVFKLQALNDKTKIAILQKHAADLGFELPKTVANYLIGHSPRDMKSLMNCLKRLDYASLAAKRRITIPFVRALLSGALNCGHGFGKKRKVC
ncbi:MAG: DnaA regulatory inactivator Hda [Gammaproteobacteria bacterium]|nr:DnaA regulatory inactivator Hda [Gammaproteobacteria bacterium]